MYIHWRTLFVLGAIFWISLCFYDTYYIDPATKSYYADAGEYEWLAQVSEEEIMQENSENRVDDIIFPDDNYVFGVSLILWNVLMFIATITVCYLGKISLYYVTQFQQKYLRDQRLENQEDIENVTKKSGSRIPVLLSSKSTLNINEELTENTVKDILFGSRASLLSSSSTGIDLSIRPSKSEMSSRIEQQMEKQCAKLRDEMITLQANSLKEHAALSRKLESVSREKRDLCRQLMITQKENRAAKHQLEELLAEKSLLIKRLDCASREFKVNTKSKKVALAKLEESQATIASLRQELEKVTYEKEIFENKLKILDAEHKNLKERLAKFEPPSQDSFTSNMIVNKNNSESNKEVINTSEEVKKSDYFEISQSQKDVQRVQMRLINLEKSLDKLKLTNWSKKDEEKKSPRSATSNVSEQSTTNFGLTNSDNEFVKLLGSSISTQSESPFEQQNETVKKLLSRSDNLTDEQRRKILEPIESSGDEYSTVSKTFDSLMEFQSEDPFERVGNLLNYIKRPSSPKKDRFNVSFSEEILNTETSTSPNDEESDDWEPPKNRIVSNSPAFQKFLKNMDPFENNRKNSAENKHIIF